MITDDYTLPEILDHLDCAECTRDEWIEVGMALKTEGYKVDDWITWSNRDTARYKDGECKTKWFGFHRDDVKAGTIIHIAMRHGWKPDKDNEAFEWDDWIGTDAEPKKLVDHNWLQPEDLPAPRDPWSPADEITRYLSALFGADEYVGICLETYDTPDGPKPTKGSYKRTAGELLERLKRFGDDIGSALGDYNPKAGAWIRFNPLDGEGVADKNVTSYRYALIESDSMELGKQYALLKELQLPIRILVFSGKKSLHAIVKVDAPNYEGYRQRVDKLYKICKENGLDVDHQNRNPSRLSRLPGVMRGENRQYIVGENLGLTSWEEWEEYIDQSHYEPLPMKKLSEIPRRGPKPELIEGMLREQHKMLLSGPSKAGKSFLLMELAVCIAEGLPWLGRKTEKCEVLYINLEIDEDSCAERYDAIKAARGIDHDPPNLTIINLRGDSCPLNELAPRLVYTLRNSSFKAIIVDPIYKIITGDENSASDMAKFCNLFDWIIKRTKAAMIYCHHHSKGSQGQKKAMDRASGSGVFARDPDAIVDLIELGISNEKRDQIILQREADILVEALDKAEPEWRVSMSEDDQHNTGSLIERLKKCMSAEEYAAVEDRMVRTRQSDEIATAWRLQTDLREFPPSKPMYCLFEYPLHIFDSHGILTGLHADGEKGAIQEAQEASKEKKRNSKIDAFDAAFAQAVVDKEDKCATRSELIRFLGIKESTLRTYSNDPDILEYYVWDPGSGGAGVWRRRVLVSEEI